MIMDAVYESYWADSYGMIHHISARCEINCQSQEIINFRLRKDQVIGMTKLFDCVMIADNTGRPVNYGSIQPMGFIGFWLDAKVYGWLRDAATKPVE